MRLIGGKIDRRDWNVNFQGTTPGGNFSIQPGVGSYGYH